MNFGIKQKILLVLVGVLMLATALDALLASYYTNRQNEESAFAALNRDLVTWQHDLDALTQRLHGVALSAGGDQVLLNQLAELVTLELNVDDPLRAKEAVEMARTLSYSKAVSLNRLHLILQTGGFSSIAVYTGGKLNQYISPSEAGMMARRGNAAPVWIKSDGKISSDRNFEDWPAWQKSQPPATIAQTIAAVDRPTTSFVFPSPDFATIEIAIPLQGVIDEFLRDVAMQPLSRFVSELRITDPAQAAGNAAPNRRPQTLAVLVFHKRIDRAALEERAAQTGKWPVLFSPDGRHQQRLVNDQRTPDDLLKKAQAVSSDAPARVLLDTVTNRKESFYEALLPWQYDRGTRMILGLTSSRESTLQNIRQTVTAILLAASLILVLSIVLGALLMGRFINPVVALTSAVKRIGIRRHPADQSAAALRITAEELRPVDIHAPDEIGELGAAFNALIAELRDTLETLEQRVQVRTAELRLQTSYLRTLIDTLPLLVWIKDTECRYLATNQANASACGRKAEDMIGKSDNELLPPELAKRSCAQDMEVMRTRRRKMVEEPITGPEGVVWMEVYRAPVIDEDGTVLGIAGAAHDISERKAAEAAREAALAEAVRLARQRSDFLAQMSHELRTPLNAILGYAQILQRDPKSLTRSQAAGLATIQESGQHLLNLINDILDLARVEAGKLTLYPAETALAPFFKMVADIIRVKADEKGVLFTYQAAPDLPDAVIVDNKRLRQVLFNLLGNAVKFTDRGEVILRVRKTAPSDAASVHGDDTVRDGDVRLRFEVEDSGVGMSDEQLLRLFQPFEQVGEERRREAGTGLGLAISQQLIHRMGGNIHVESEPGKGSLFWFELDLPIAAALITIESPLQRIITNYEGPRKKLMIVDDVPQNRIMLMDATLPLGFEVVDAENGRQCLDLLDSARPDLILMDVMMPVMDGYEATRRIRELPEFADIPIIFVSASVTPADETRCRAAGANAFLGKPIEQDVLLKVIGEQLSLRWTYETQEAHAAGEPEEAVDFVIPPPEEIEKLYMLARLGNMQQINIQAEQVKSLDPRYAAFAKRLQGLAVNYQSKAIVVLLEKCRAQQQVE
jgi:PAS domain S-box-containing protein